ncbi:MAG: hypothetical protein A4E29_01043 [Methanomassiliicoccales archaeon PtaB.Bin134]|nr:MAG: hypothetical protein A4E29_01043 [Methanomassiliicoccales archaeon PtaB.Bin134]
MKIPVMATLLIPCSSRRAFSLLASGGIRDTSGTDIAPCSRSMLIHQGMLSRGMSCSMSLNGGTPSATHSTVLLHTPRL